MTPGVLLHFSGLLDNVLSLLYLDHRRARAEAESRRKALQERAKKGLLTAEEKAKLEEEEKELRSGAQKKDKDGCIVC